MQIEVNVPMMISDCTRGRTAFYLEVSTLKEALDALVTTYPLLRVHLYTEQGQLRKHVLIYYNEDNITWLQELDIPLKNGDTLRVLQAVSGG